MFSEEGDGFLSPVIPLMQCGQFNKNLNNLQICLFFQFQNVGELALDFLLAAVFC